MAARRHLSLAMFLLMFLAAAVAEAGMSLLVYLALPVVAAPRTQLAELALKDLALPGRTARLQTHPQQAAAVERAMRATWRIRRQK
jgi:uncharacterized cupredoxin-like copper-binding protein